LTAQTGLIITEPLSTLIDRDWPPRKILACSATLAGLAPLSAHYVKERGASPLPYSHVFMGNAMDFTAKDAKDAKNRKAKRPESKSQEQVRLNAQPFKPFRLCLSDGKSFDIINHDMAWVKEGAIEIGVELNREGFAVHTAEYSILHITRLEDVATDKAA
jgi:hypothetical protein